MHFLQRLAKCTILIVTLLNPDILQPLQSSTLLVVLAGMWAAGPVGPLYRQLLSLRLVQRVIFAIPKHKVKSLRLVHLRDRYLHSSHNTRLNSWYGNKHMMPDPWWGRVRSLLSILELIPRRFHRLIFIGNWKFGIILLCTNNSNDC